MFKIDLIIKFSDTINVLQAYSIKHVTSKHVGGIWFRNLQAFNVVRLGKQDGDDHKSGLAHTG